ncbi:MAG: Cys-tRNA(Pro) deacylase [Firmicutes bacterium]|nr:Cys-tRNA(Pro) deacylase [Bacillota bacterium]
MEKKEKTNAMRLLDEAGLAYTAHSYNADDGKIDGLSVAAKIAMPAEQVYKTLVTQGNSGDYFVFVLPVGAELDLKKAAKAAKQKHVEMIPVKDILRVTGYIRGGCSPIGMKKSYPTFVEEEAMLYDTIVFSGGKIGAQIEMNPDALIEWIGGAYAPLCK